MSATPSTSASSSSAVPGGSPPAPDDSATPPHDPATARHSGDRETASAGPLQSSLPEAVRAAVDLRFSASAEAVESFFSVNDELVARACLDMARRFGRGGRLLVHGAGPHRSDAEHVAVEFVHPVIVGKRALPALSLQEPAETELSIIGRPEDILLAVGDHPKSKALVKAGREAGLLTLSIGPADALGRDDESGRDAGAELAFALEGDDPLAAQEVAETLYHVLWELVHVFLDRSDLGSLSGRSSGDAS